MPPRPTTYGDVATNARVDGIRPTRFVCSELASDLRPPYLLLTRIDAIAGTHVPRRYAAGRVGGTMTGCLNAANEMANEMFREGAFEYLDIPRVIEAAMEAHKADFVQEPSLDEIIEVDLWARRFVKDFASAKKEVFA